MWASERGDRLHGVRRQRLGKVGNHCVQSVSHFQTVIALSSVDAEFYTLQGAAAGDLQAASRQAGDGQCKRWCEARAEQRSGVRHDQA